MELTTAFLIYAGLFRLAIIGAGVISIVLGYRLLCRGLWPKNAPESGAAFDAQFAGVAIGIKNAGPGTLFSLFGVILITVMVITGSPELRQQVRNKRSTGDTTATVGDASVKSDAQSGGTSAEGATIALRGAEGDRITVATQRGLAFEAANQTEEAIRAYQDALDTLAAPMNNLAWLYLQSERAEQGVRLARMAVGLRPDEAKYLDTLAESLYRRGEHEEALSTMQTAARLDAKFSAKLKRFERSR